ncbi:hypothetical protein, partial [Clostridium tarantellae]
MLNIFPYYTIVLLIIFLCVINLKENLKNSPAKIKILLSGTLILLFLRYILILLCGLINKQEYLNIIKPLSFLYFLYIPIMIIVCFYIFWRNDKVKFTQINVLSLFLFIIYLIAITFFKTYFQASWHYGYIIRTDNEIYFKGIYILILTIILCCFILCKKGNYCNNKGIAFLIIIVVLIILENALYLLGYYYFPNCILSE